MFLPRKLHGFWTHLGQRPLQTYLVALAVAAAVPAFAAAAFAVWQAADSYRSASAARLLDTARTLARAVESELDNRATLLRALAAASVIDRASPGQLQDWLEQAGLSPQSRIAAEPLETFTPPAGAPGLTPAGVPLPAAQEAARTGQPALSNLYRLAGDTDDDPPRVSLSIAQGRPSAKPRLVSLIVPPDQLVRTAYTDPSIQASILVAVTDGTGHVVARSRDARRFIGKPVPDWAKLQALGTDQGVFEAVTTEGRPVIFAFNKLRGTPGWVVVVGEPLAVFNARWTAPLRQMALGGVSALVLALLLATWLTRQILVPVRKLARHARAVAAGEVGPTAAAPAAALPLPIREFESLRETIAASEDFLRQRAELERQNARMLAASEHRYRTLAEAGALILWRAEPAHGLVAAAGWAQLTGQDEAQALGMGWLRDIHPEDRPAVKQAAGPDISVVPRFDLEFRIRTGEGAWRWVRARGAPIRGAAGEVIEWIGVIEDVDERRQAQARIVHMAHHDALTGLPNRTQFWERLGAAIGRAGRGEGGAVLYIDLDRFKEVNDTLGHPVGDGLLHAVTQRLQALVRDTDTVARLGGDEFAIAQSQVGTPADAADLATRIVDSLSAPYEINGHQVRIGASVGITLIRGPGDDPERLLKNADMALYRAKHEGRGRHCFFEPEMDARMQQRRQTELGLRQALVRGEFELSYQPLVHVHSRRLSGLEMRVHWNHPERGPLPWQAFGPLAEDIGLIVPIGTWALQQACADAVGWPGEPRLAIKISRAQLAHARLPEIVEQALAASGLAAGRLELEIVEGAFLAQPEAMMQTLVRLKSLGVRIVMDAFGSGHSALGCLRSFPFDKVKIEPSFVRDLGRHKDGDAIVRAVAGLCDKLGIMTAAEGVETEAQFALLSAEECAEVQGPLFGGFRPSAEVPALCEAPALGLAGTPLPRSIHPFS